MATKNRNFIVKNGLTAQGGIQSDSDVDVTGDISATGTITGATLSGSLDASNLTGNIDSDRITQVDVSKIANLSNLDSAAVNSLISAADTHDSALVQAQIDSNFNNGITITKNSTDDPALILQTTADGSSAAPIMEFIRNTSQANNGDYLGQIKFRGEDSGGSATTDIYAKITGKISDATDGTEDGLIEFAVKNDGGNTILARMTGAGTNGRLDILNGADISVATGGDITVDGNSVLTTASTYVQSVSAGSGIKSSGISGSTPTVTVDSAFITGLFSASEGVSYSNGVIGLDATDSVSFVNITSFGEINIFDSANGEEVGHLEGDPNNGLIIHSHAHATDGGIRFVIHNSADSDYLILSRPTGISVVNRRIRNVGAPTDDLDAATKSYVDGVAQGLSIRDPAKAATVAPLTSTNDITAIAYDSGALGFGSTLTLTATVGLDSVDGFTLTSGDRIIVKDETGPNLPFNGIYVWNNAKLLTRATDMDSASEFNGGEFVFVQEGTINGGNGFSQKDAVTTLGQNAVHFVQFSGAGQITAGDGIAKTGNTLNLDITSTNPGVLIDGSNQLQTKVDDTTIENSANGLRVKDNGITISKLAGTEAAAAEQVTVENILENTGETLSTTALRERLEDGIYKIYTTAIGDSDTTALVDSAYVRPLARAALVAGSNITYDSATGVISGVAAYGDADVTALVDSAYVQARADSDYIKTVTGIDAGTLGGQAIGAFLRSDTSDAFTSGTLTFNSGTTVAFENTTGTAPFTVASTTNVPNLNASSLSGVAAGSFLRSDATDNYTSGTLTFDNGATVAFAKTTGTSPFTVASTTVVTNLNADQLDGQHGAYYRIAIQDSTGTVLNP